MKRREDSFFGIHFDFHAMPGQVVGEIVRADIIEEMLDRVKPDYVQCDTKGHYGISSYPTKVGHKAEVIKADTLKMWRELTKQRGIALYAHHSGLFDREVARLHPDWAIKDEKGNVSGDYISPFSPYADEILIPQLKELALDYEMNGAWIDGDCWATFVDYSDYAVKEYIKEYGNRPPESNDENYEEYKEFCRQGFRRYVAHYVEAVKAVASDFEITSNWIYSKFMPEKAEIGVDFLSGDYAPSNSMETARHEARCLAARNIPWDLLAWGQNVYPLGSFEIMNRTTKECEQLCQEAAEVISCGGGFQFFNILYGGGGMVQKWAIPIWEKVAEFCRKREFCHKATPVYQLGIMLSEEVMNEDTSAVYTAEYRNWQSLCSWNNALLDCGFSTNVIFESEEMDYNKYPVIVITEGVKLKKETLKLLEKYVYSGGRLVVDLKAAKHFTSLLELEIKSMSEELIFIRGNNALAAAKCEVAEFSGEANEIGRIYSDNFFESMCYSGALQKNIGDGNITFMRMDFGKIYENNISAAIKNFLKEIILKTGYKPLVQVSGSDYAEICLTEKEGRLFINIINTAGQSAVSKVRSFGEVPEIGPLKIRLMTEESVNITEMPKGRKIKYKHKNGCIEFEIDKVHIHSVVVIEKKKGK